MSVCPYLYLSLGVATPFDFKCWGCSCNGPVCIPSICSVA